MKKKTQPEIPFVLRKELAESNILHAVNESAKAIPFCTIEDILTNLLHQVRERADNEREIARQSYKKQMAEYIKKAEKEEEVCKKQ
jgi:hypothetical protein